jgi:hypothetical protein
MIELWKRSLAWATSYYRSEALRDRIDLDGIVVDSIFFVLSHDRTNIEYDQTGNIDLKPLFISVYFVIRRTVYHILRKEARLIPLDNDEMISIAVHPSPETFAEIHAEIDYLCGSDEKLRALVHLMMDDPQLAARDIAAISGRTRKEVYRIMKRLRRRGREYLQIRSGRLVKADVLQNQRGGPR